MRPALEKGLDGALQTLREDPLFKRFGVVRFRTEFGEDANGEPAVWVYVIVPDRTALGLAGGPKFAERFRIRDALAAAGWSYRIYTRFRRHSEETNEADLEA